MKAGTSFTLNLTGALLIMIASATIAAAQTGNDTCAGLNATIGGTCRPLTNDISGNNQNSAYGDFALENNASGFGNTAVGGGALSNNPSAGNNTAIGLEALEDSTGGINNTATGVIALSFNTGDDNTATGAAALLSNSSGSHNTATGFDAMQFNDTGTNNTAVGAFAETGSSGSFNISIGNNAGSSLSAGGNNIEIGNAGVAADANTIRIGTQGTQTETFIAGIFNSPGARKACQVVVQSNGRLGCVGSSARYKHDIHDMGTASDKLMKLRPVIFQYKEDSSGIRQYGLIAEEVEKVYPELVIDGSDGRAQTVAYQELPAMLLNEVQKERRQLAQKDAEIAAMRRQLAALQKKNSEIDAMADRLDALERQARASEGGHLAVALH